MIPVHLTSLESTVLCVLAPEFGAVKFSLGQARIPSLSEEQLLDALISLERKGYVRSEKDSQRLRWFTHTGIKLALEIKAGGHQPQPTPPNAEDERYALYLVNTSTGSVTRLPKDRWHTGTRESVEQQAALMRSNLDPGVWTIETRQEKPGVAIEAAVSYIPGEDDVDPDELAQGKGKEDVSARDMRDDNAGDRGGIHTSSITAVDEDRIPEFVEAVHAYLDDEADLARASETSNEDTAESLNDPEWLSEITPAVVTEALSDVLPEAFDRAQLEDGALIKRITQELRDNPGPYTVKDCVNLTPRMGELQSLSLGETPVQACANELFRTKILEPFGEEFTRLHLGQALDSYRGLLNFTATTMHLHLRNPQQPFYTTLNLFGHRWVRCMTPKGALALVNPPAQV